MKKPLLTLALLAVVGAASAQGFGGPPCYSWNGGNFSSGGFVRCEPEVIVIHEPAPIPAPVALPPPVAQSPILMPMSAPKPIFKPKRKPRPKLICKPA